MKRLLSLALCTAVIGFAGVSSAKTDSASQGRDYSDYNFAVDSGNNVLTSASSSLFFKAGVGADSFALYGDADNFPEGKFSDTNQVLPDMQGWEGVDLTDQFNPWQLSTFNASNLDAGAGNTAAWCGRSAAQEPGWATSPGYGNNWNAILLWESATVPTGNPLDVALDFVYNHDTEPGYDFLHVEYDSNGTWTEIFSTDGNNKDTNGVYQAATYSSTTDVHYAGNDYGGTNSDQVRIRIRVSSDGAWSDQDGLWPTTAGAAQVDNIVVNSTEFSSSTDFEGGFGDWQLDKAAYAGEFAKVFAKITDIDPCRENTTPVIGFIDDGSPVSNPDALAFYGTDTTGGTTSNTWSYGISGGWVLNYNGGLSNGQTDLNNEVWSPVFEWDVAGTTADDGPEVSGSVLQFNVWRHLTLANGMFYVWHVRSSTDGGASFDEWADRNFVYYGEIGDWLRVSTGTTDLIQNGATHVQIALGVVDLAALFAFPGSDATVSPAFDSVRFVKYEIGGPSFATRNIDLFQDSFPSGGGIAASDDLERDLLDIRVDMARDVSTGTANIPGDSIIIDVVAVIPGTTVDMSGIDMVWIMDKNPLFDAVRATPPAGTSTVVGGAANGWDQWTGTVAADTSTTSAGAKIADRFFFDLPDADFFYPGDVIRYYIQAEDDASNITTLPGNISGFSDGDGYSRTFTIRGLPTIVDDGLGGTTQPDVLLINDFGRRGGENDYLSAFGQNGFAEGVDFDTYTVQGPSSGVANGIGGRANADQLGNYGCLVYVAGDLAAFSLSNGTDAGNNDKGDDVGVLDDWHNLAGDRYVAYFGDGVASHLQTEGGASDAFLQNVMSVDVNDNDVRDEIGDQTAALVVPASGSFSTSYVAFGGCLGINRFDSIGPLGSAVAGHSWTQPDGVTPYAGIAASVVHDRTDGLGDRKVDVTFPHGLIFVFDDINATNTSPAVSARAKLLSELFALFGNHTGTSPATPADVPQLMSSADVVPTPFNPSTTIKYTTGTRSVNVVKVYDAMGRLVNTLVNEMREPGLQSIAWQGQDASGAPVASGVYMFEIVADGKSLVKKGVLLK